MRQLWLFLSKYHLFFLFLFLQGIGFGLLFNRSNYQAAKFLHSTSAWQSSVAKQQYEVTSFFNLRKENNTLLAENVALKNQLQAYQQDSIAISSIYVDTLFRYTAAHVISNPQNRTIPYLTIDKGSKQGVSISDGIITPEGAVGKVVQVRENYALVMPLFNRLTKVNVQHEDSKYNGNLVWVGQSNELLQVENIPRNAAVELQDTIITNLYSRSVPVGTPIGTVQEASFESTGNFYALQVKPVVDFRKLNAVYVVHRIDEDLIRELEQSVDNE